MKLQYVITGYEPTEFGAPFAPNNFDFYSNWQQAILSHNDLLFGSDLAGVPSSHGWGRACDGHSTRSSLKRDEVVPYFVLLLLFIFIVVYIYMYTHMLVWFGTISNRSTSVGQRTFFSWTIQRTLLKSLSNMFMCNFSKGVLHEHNTATTHCRKLMLLCDYHFTLRSQSRPPQPRPTEQEGRVQNHKWHSVVASLSGWSRSFVFDFHYSSNYTGFYNWKH